MDVRYEITRTPAGWDVVAAPDELYLRATVLRGADAGRLVAWFMDDTDHEDEFVVRPSRSVLDRTAAAVALARATGRPVVLP